MHTIAIVSRRTIRGLLLLLRKGETMYVYSLIRERDIVINQRGIWLTTLSTLSREPSSIIPPSRVYSRLLCVTLAFLGFALARILSCSLRANTHWYILALLALCSDSRSSPHGLFFMPVLLLLSDFLAPAPAVLFRSFFFFLSFIVSGFHVRVN